jgi:hypothetical protein
VESLEPDAFAYDYRATEWHPKAVQICYYNSCRHVTGNLCTSYYPSQRPILDWTTSFPSFNPLEAATLAHRFFCTRCGCHVFKSVPDGERAHASDNVVKIDRQTRWGSQPVCLMPLLVWCGSLIMHSLQIPRTEVLLAG